MDVVGVSRDFVFKTTPPLLQQYRPRSHFSQYFTPQSQRLQQLLFPADRHTPGYWNDGEVDGVDLRPVITLASNLGNDGEDGAEKLHESWPSSLTRVPSNLSRDLALYITITGCRDPQHELLTGL